MVQIDKPFVRESGEWPFPNAITETICQYAGREASAMLFSAIGPWENGGLAARKATYCEPFKYWDWHGVHPDEQFTRTRGLKRQLTWERQRGYRQEDCHGEFGYPSPRARWQAFKTLIATHSERRFWVKHIAMAHWMDKDDLNWIAHQLPNLEGLDLSDTLVRRTGSGTGACSSGSKVASLPSAKIPELLAKLKWLAIPDAGILGSEHKEVFPLEQYLSMCAVLQTLCIRDTRDEYMRPYVVASAAAALDWITKTVANIPATTTNLELRICQPSVGRLVAELVQRKPNITHIGIDVGVWSQTYLLTTGQVTEEKIHNHVAAAAFKSVLHTYEGEHNKVFPIQSKWWLPNSLAPAEGRTGQVYQADGPTLTRDMYQNQHIEALNADGAQVSTNQVASCGDSRNKSTSAEIGHDRSNSTSLYEDLFRLYKAGTSKGHEKVQIFPLTPEWQINSTDAIHPLTMLRPESDGQSISTGQLMNLYNWLNKTFGWRPVFDWDYFMKFDSPSGQDTLVKQITQQFQHMRDAYIPIKILIGRRHSDLSSLYWGHDETAWAQTLHKSFNNSLGQIAPLVDALIIHYDLRNPLDYDRLREIDKQEPYIGPAAVCPRSLCPWKRKYCPFEKQWDERPMAKSTQSTAMGSATNASYSHCAPKHSPRLASSSILCLPTGEDANLHTLDDYDPANARGEHTLHKLARHAAYLREAVGWQRFWTDYSPKLTNLSELHVRMPRAFDKVGNLRLRKLLDPREGWKMHNYTEERQHLQTREDLEWSIGSGDNKLTHLPENKTWPGGRFVRRLWIRMDASPSFEVPALDRASENLPAPEKRASNSALDNLCEDEIERIEREELERAIRAAKMAGQREGNYQQSLETARKIQAPAIGSIFEGIEKENTRTRRETAVQGLSAEERRNRMIAQRIWLAEMQDYAHGLSQRNIESVIQHDLHKSSNDIKTIASDALQIREVLRNTRAELERRITLCPEDVLQAKDTSSLLEDLVKELAEKRARPMAKQLLEQEGRKAVAQAKADAVAASASSSAETENANIPIATSEGSEDTQNSVREIPETPPLPDDYVFDDQPGDGFVPKHVLGLSQPFEQPLESLNHSDIDSLFGESLEPARPVDLPASELPISPPDTTIQTLGDSPVDIRDENFWDGPNGNSEGEVSKFPNMIPETIDVEQFDITHTIGQSVTGLGTSILGSPRVQGDIPVAPVMRAQVEEVASVEETTVTEQVTTGQHTITIEESTQIETHVPSTPGPPEPNDIITTTEIPDITQIFEIPETPGVTETQFDHPIPTPKPSIVPTSLSGPKQPPQPAFIAAPITVRARTPAAQLPATDEEPENPTKKRTRNPRSTTPAVGSRHSTRSVTPVSYVEIDSDEDEGGPKKKRKVTKKGKKNTEWTPTKGEKWKGTAAKKGAATGRKGK